jgi:hypothetical protein
VRADTDHRGTLIDLDTNQKLTDIVLPHAGEQPSTLELPAGVRHGLIWLETDRASVTLPPNFRTTEK